MNAIGVLIFLFISFEINCCIATSTEYILSLTLAFDSVDYGSQNTTSTCQLNCNEPFRFVVSHRMSDVVDQQYEFNHSEELLGREIELNFRQTTKTSNTGTRVRLQFLSTHPRYGFTENCWTNEMIFSTMNDLLVYSRLEHVRTPCFIVKITAKAFKLRVRWLDSFGSSELSSTPQFNYNVVLCFLIVSLFIVLLALILLIGLKYRSERRKARALDRLIKFGLEHGPSSNSQSYVELQSNT